MATSKELFSTLLAALKHHVNQELGTIIDLQLLDDKSAAIYLRMQVKPIMDDQAALEKRALELDPRVKDLSTQSKQRIREYLTALCELL